MRTLTRLPLSLLLIAALSACGGGSSDDGGPEFGSLSLALTDAPIDHVEEVWVRFTGVTVKPQDAEQIHFDFGDNPVDVDMLTLTGGNTQHLLVNERVPAGPYNWMRFEVDDSDIAFSYVIPEAGGRVPLRVPSDALRFVSGFTVTVNRETSFVIDWVIRKALTDAVGRGEYQLRPAFRVTDATAYAAISGTVHPDLIELDSDACDSDPQTLAGNTVYLYPDMSGAPEADFDDIYVTEALEEGPLTTANVAWDDAMNYSYRIDYVSPGSYTLAFTCQGLTDQPDTDEDIEFRAFVDVTIEHPDSGAMPADVTDADFTAG